MVQWDWRHLCSARMRVRSPTWCGIAEAGGAPCAWSREKNKTREGIFKSKKKKSPQTCQTRLSSSQPVAGPQTQRQSGLGRKYPLLPLNSAA